jgi:hypothetical protein
MVHFYEAFHFVEILVIQHLTALAGHFCSVGLVKWKKSECRGSFVLFQPGFVMCKEVSWFRSLKICEFHKFDFSQLEYPQKNGKMNTYTDIGVIVHLLK